MQRIDISGRTVGEGSSPFIIAEVGINHNGDLKLAKAMVDAIAQSGADCVKFQTFSAKEFCNSPDETYEYRSQGKWVKESMLNMFERLEIKREGFAQLFAYARERGLIPMSTPTDRQAVDLLEELDCPAYKIGSDDLVYTPFLEYVASKQRPVIISTGMAEFSDVQRAVQAIRKVGNNQVLVLHCVSLYPTPEDAVNLRKIRYLQERVGCPIGYSDHSEGITACLGAVALGACVLEKHFTLDKGMAGPDHWFSADPSELNSLVKQVRRLELNLGSSDFEMDEREQEMATLCHRSIVTASQLPQGHVIAEGDLAFKRPGTGLMPYEISNVLGKRTRVQLDKGHRIALDDLEIL